jgi:arylsulfatase A
VLILADDMGYGDIRAYNPASKIPTPHLDRVAAEGMRFTDMHAGASWCMPSRYALMTGRYAWRDGHAKGLPKKPSGHRIDKGAPTLATVLKERGYRTACIGKWHLGMGERGAKHEVRKGVRIPMGPNDAGFDESYILHGSLDFGPYVFFENQMPIATPTERIPERNWPNTRRAMGEYWHASKGMPGWDFRQVLPHLRDQAVGFVERQSARQPFFLYFPLTAPHTPWMPTKEFPGRSGAGMYGDFVMQVDSVVGDVVRAIDQAGFGKAGDRYAIRSTLSLVSGQKLWFRERDWKAISFLGSGGNTEPKKHRSKPGEPRGQLYHLGKDIGEEENRYQSHPEILKKLQQRRRDLFPNSPLGGI